MGIGGDIGMKPRYATHSGRHFVGDGSVEKDMIDSFMKLILI